MNALFNEINNERLKFNSTFKQFAFRTIQNLIVVILQMNNKSQYITFFTFSINNYIFWINDFLTFLNNLSLSFNFNANIFTLISIDELIIDFILQKSKFFNSIDVKQKVFDRYSKFRFVKDFFVNSLIDLIVIKKVVFVKTDLIIVKTTLILLVKAISIDFYEFKLYKKVITNAQHKIN